jgi:hypothetical protein
MDIKLSDLIYIKRNALSPEQCDKLIQEQNERNTDVYFESCLHAITGIPTTSTFRGMDLNPGTENFNIIHNKTDEMIGDWIDHLQKFNSFHMNTLKRSLLYSHRLRLLRYDVGGWIHPHIDWDNFTHGSCTFALNDDYVGGEFSFFNGKHNIKLNAGDAMIFPADAFWVHEVKEITKGTRYSTNSFITSIAEEDRNNINTWYYNSERVINEFRYQIGKNLGEPHGY